MRAIVFFICCLILTACTSKWQKITTMTEEDLVEYKERRVNDFIWQRYIKEYESGLGGFYKGLDYIASTAESLIGKRKLTIEDIKEQYKLYPAFYNLADYSKLLKPSQELATLCRVKGGKFSLVNAYSVNLPKLQLDQKFTAEFIGLVNQYQMADSTSERINRRNPELHLTEDISIPIVVTAEEIRRNALKNLGKLQAYQKAMSHSSNTRVMLVNDQDHVAARAFQAAIDNQAFGEFRCEAVSEQWAVLIRPLLNENRQRTMNSLTYIQIISTDGSINQAG